MAGLTVIPLPYGLRDVKIYPITAGVPAATGIDLPNGRTLQFTENEDFAELRGDDALKAVHGQGPTVDWTLEGGGVSLEVVAAMYGGTVTTTGTAPAQVKKLLATGTKQRPYFKMAGQSISDSGGDFITTIYNCKCNGDLTGQQSDGNFWLTGAKGIGMPDASGNLWDFTQNETATTLS